MVFDSFHLNKKDKFYFHFIIRDCIRSLFIFTPNSFVEFIMRQSNIVVHQRARAATYMTAANPDYIEQAIANETQICFPKKKKGIEGVCKKKTGST